ncbi:MAG: indolepyruvate oxidoreductase subunit beta family protein, partial [Burkholderiaceae bacterium]|nr:indolepyruvate oxidoreductase subunit beta family protein [Burkholderiaceae bacterium]
VDIVIASELMEAGRALQRGLVSSDRTTLIASTHRVYSMTERTAMGDGRVDSDKLLEGCRAAAKRLVALDFARIAGECGSPISPALCGALAATGELPFDRKQYEATITRAGVGVKASLAAFAAGFDSALRAFSAGPGEPATRSRHIGASAAAASQSDESGATRSGEVPTPLGARLRGLRQRVEEQFPQASHATLAAAILRLADYQDVGYAASYLDRLAPLAHGHGAEAAPRPELFEETARHLALWMTYEDAVRVADLKTRRTRFERVGKEVRLEAGQLVHIVEFMHPRIEEIADVLPAGVGRWLLATGWARACFGPFVRKGRFVRTSSLHGFVLLYLIAALRPTRRGSLRFRREHERIDRWLATIERLARTQPDLALEVARAQRLVKGYGDTHARGWRNFERLMSALPQLRSQDSAAARMRALTQAALADESGQTLDRMLAAPHAAGTG